MFDVVAAVVVVVVLLLPAPSKRMHDYHAAARAPLSEVIARAQGDLVRSPADHGALERLTEALLDAGHSDWALRVVGERAALGGAESWRARLLVSLVHGDRLDVKAAHEWSEQAVLACGATGSSCRTHDRFRLELYADMLSAGVKSGIDPKTDPVGFQKALLRVSPVVHPR